MSVSGAASAFSWTGSECVLVSCWCFSIHAADLLSADGLTEQRTENHWLPLKMTPWMCCRNDWNVLFFSFFHSWVNTVKPFRTAERWTVHVDCYAVKKGEMFGHSQLLPNGCHGDVLSQDLLGSFIQASSVHRRFPADCQDGFKTKLLLWKGFLILSVNLAELFPLWSRSALCWEQMEQISWSGNHTGIDSISAFFKTY